MYSQGDFVSNHGRKITEQQTIIEGESQPGPAAANISVDLLQTFNLPDDLFVTENQSKCPERRFWHSRGCHSSITEPGRQTSKECFLQTMDENCLKSCAKSSGDIIQGQEDEKGAGGQ